jgi:glycosyltransferase involved in cell wall biosynthesis
MAEDKTIISLVVPAYNEEGNIAALARRVFDVIPDEYAPELIFVDDGSDDGTLQAIKELQDEHPSVSYISFSRNFGHQAALRAGIRQARGGCVISMDADLQHPPELLPPMLKQWREGNDIVYTRRARSGEGSWFKSATSRLFYGTLNRLSGLDMDQGAADFRLLDRSVVDVLNSLPEQNLFLRGFVSWCGFRAHAIDYEPGSRLAGESKYTFGRMMTLALHGITQFSIRPLRLASFLGFFSAAAGIIYGIYAIWRRFGSHQTVSGWTSVIISVLILGGIQLLILGIMGEYLGWTFLQSKQRPDYIIRERG